MRATYRLQLGGALGFQEARALVPYLRELGVSHLYLSPLLQARSGSMSGYDVVDPSRVSEELGGERGLRELAAAGLGVIADIVPNHMAACEENPFWTDERLRGRFFDIDPVTGRHRRFFDIDELAGVRQEDDEVFRATHEKVLQLVREGIVDGLRIDHIDGLADPAGYLHRLRQEGVAQVWVEKILQTNEALRDWPVEGTVGYEFLNDVTALFVDQWGEEGLTSCTPSSPAIGGASAKWPWARRSSRRPRRSGPRSSACVGSRTCPGSPSRSPGCRRTEPMCNPPRGIVSDADRVSIELAQMPARLASALLLQTPKPPELVVRFQQTSPAIKAKGVEDTAFYRYNRLLALNEVGAIRSASASRWRRSMRATWSARGDSHAGCSPPRRTTPSAAATCARASP